MSSIYGGGFIVFQRVYSLIFFSWFITETEFY